MNSSTATASLVYMATAYMAAYLLYLLLKAAAGDAGYGTTPYDASRLVLRRKYV